VNNIEYGYAFELKISLIACLERREEVNKSSGEIEIKYSEHTWISSIQFSIDIAHEICNLGARMKESIEDSFNTEKIEAIITNMLTYTIGMRCKDSIY
jgi:hypothetical protein